MKHPHRKRNIMAPPAPQPPKAKAAPGNVPLDCLPNNEFLKFLYGHTLLDILRVVGAKDNSGKWAWIDPVHAWATKQGGFIAPIADVISQLFGGLADMNVWLADILVKGATKSSGCPTPDITLAALADIVLGVLRRWAIDVPEQLTKPWTHYTQWACPVGVPDQPWLNEALATNSISFGDYRCLTRLNGNAEKWQFLDVNLRQKRPTEEDALLLWRKGWITDQQYAQVMSRLGWTDPNMRNLWEWSQIYTPTPSEAIEWMVKDVADPLIQNTFGLGQEFTLKYNGRVKEVFDANGIAQADAENIWRAHWRNMAPHQLYEMHKRLRPGYYDTWKDEDVLTYARSIAPRAPTGPGADIEIKQRREFWGDRPLFRDEIRTARDARSYLSITVTESFQVFEALGQNDYPPYWRDKLMAVSYAVMTRTDARRAYEIGAIDDERLRAVLLDRGYAPQDARALVLFYRQNYLLAMSRKPVCGQWVKTGFSRALLEQALSDLGLRDELVPELVTTLMTRRKIYLQTQCMAAWKKDYKRRLYTADEIRAKLQDAGLTIAEANDVVSQWDCERAAPHKQAAAAALGNEFKTGVITEQQYRQGLVDLKYRTRDIRRMVAQRKLVPVSKKWAKAPAPEPESLPGDE